MTITVEYNLFFQILQWGTILEKAENVLTVAQFQHLFGEGMEQDIIYVTPVVSITRWTAWTDLSSNPPEDW